MKDGVVDKVKRVLRKHPDAFGNYGKLIQYVWCYEDGLAKFIPPEKMDQLTNPESIGRAYRQLVESGKIKKPDGQQTAHPEATGFEPLDKFMEKNGEH